MANVIESISVDDTDPSIIYYSPRAPWTVHTNVEESFQLYEDTDTFSDVQGATATYTFQGDAIEYWGNQGPYHGPCQVTLDGVDEQRVNSHAAADDAPILLYAKNGLQYGSHTIVITVVNPSYPNVCEVDRFVVNSTITDNGGGGGGGNSNSSSNSNRGKNNSSKWAAIGGGIGGAVVLILLFFVFFCYVKRNKRKRNVEKAILSTPLQSSRNKSVTPQPMIPQLNVSRETEKLGYGPGGGAPTAVPHMSQTLNQGQYPHSVYAPTTIASSSPPASSYSPSPPPQQQQFRNQVPGHGQLSPTSTTAFLTPNIPPNSMADGRSLSVGSTASAGISERHPSGGYYGPQPGLQQQIQAMPGYYNDPNISPGHQQGFLPASSSPPPQQQQHQQQMSTYSQSQPYLHQDAGPVLGHTTPPLPLTRNNTGPGVAPVWVNQAATPENNDNRTTAGSSPPPNSYPSEKAQYSGYQTMSMFSDVSPGAGGSGSDTKSASGAVQTGDLKDEGKEVKPAETVPATTQSATPDLPPPAYQM